MSGRPNEGRVKLTCYVLPRMDRGHAYVRGIPRES